MTRKTEEAINSYITDMLALEDHIAKALKGQISDLDDDHREFASHLSEFHGIAERHIATLKGLSDARDAAGGKIAEAIKRAGSAVAGVGAAAIDFVRNEKLPKDLRDDYTACSLATIGYVMLYTTAVALNDTPVARIAYEHFRDYARTTMTLHHIIPSAVVKFLLEDKLPANADTLSEITKSLESGWWNESGGVPESGTASISN